MTRVATAAGAALLAVMVAAVAAGLVWSVRAAGAEGFTSARLVAATTTEVADPFGGCMEFELAGTCEWICLDPPYIPGGTTYLETTPLVRHYLPTAVVTVHAGSGCPWTEGRAVLAPFAASPLAGAGRFGGGLSVRGDGARPETRGEVLRPGAELAFYEAEVFGSATGALVTALAGTVPGIDFVCPAAVRPMPYYASVVDPLWRFGEAGMVAAVQDVVAHPPLGRGLRETVGGVPMTWGTLFPVSGWMDSGHDYRNAANVAQRAAFVVSNRRFGIPGPFGTNRHVRAGMAGGGGAALPAPEVPETGRTELPEVEGLGGLSALPAFPAAQIPVFGGLPGFTGLPALPTPAGLPEMPGLPVPSLDVMERSGAYSYGDWGTIWLPPGVVPGGGKFKWRQVLPDVAGCHRFATAGTSGALPFAGSVVRDGVTLATDPLAGRMNRDGGYGWQLWREYECCANPCAVRVAGPVRLAF